jgi:hypothetical protein
VSKSIYGATQDALVTRNDNRSERGVGKKKNANAKKKKLTTLEEALAEIQTKPLVNLYPPVAMVYGVSRGTVYEMARRGEVDVLEVGRLKKAVTASLRKKLGI